MSEQSVQNNTTQTKKRVLVTGINSYIGQSFIEYVNRNFDEYIVVETISLRNDDWIRTNFSSFDSIFHVAGIAHADIGEVSKDDQKKYYEINRDLTLSVAGKAVNDGVKQFIYMSSMIIYGSSKSLKQPLVVDKKTKPNPSNFYGDSKWQADKALQSMSTEQFKVAIVRPPMIYGKGSKGNYQALSKLALKLPIFPKINNQRSILFIDNLSRMICEIIVNSAEGIFFPQNKTYSSTSSIVHNIAMNHDKSIHLTKLLNPFIWIASKVPGRISQLTNKAFSSAIYDIEMSKYEDFDYQLVDFERSIEITEKKD